ncbi:tRNA pseudouridine(13) synthase TruD [Thiohalorhabdus sp. Cl-TMA]|uniref:tRNA pseudouridine synthase D n=1 Tax=Thiohalorhabdus methylotrophus TaxID=3242694 RepID=A0ABV4TXB7_9GAMM
MTISPEPESLPHDPWPVAHARFRPEGRFRLEAEDFRVTEILPFEAEGYGHHFLLRIRKVGVNTDRVAQDLARLAGCRARDVGYAGLKDRKAVAVQHFSVPAAGVEGDPGRWSGESWMVERVDRARKKLKRGALEGNAFRLRLHLSEEDAEVAAARFEELLAAGVPNYFGPQRFGREGGNLVGARQLFGGTARPNRGLRGIYLSAARSYLFNRVAATRVVDGTWDRLREGEYAVFPDVNSGFVVSDPEREAPRVASGDLHPSGPLPGLDGAGPKGEAAELEGRILAEETALVEGIRDQKVEAHRRALRVLPRDGLAEADSRGLWIAFRLPAGSFATSVVRELVRPITS